MEHAGIVYLTEDAEFRLLDLYTAPVDSVPKYESTMCGFIVTHHYDLWEAGLIKRVGRSSIRLTDAGLLSLGID